MKKQKKKSDIAIINTWIEWAETAFAVYSFEMGSNVLKKILKPTDRANVFEIETADGPFKIIFERK